ncbi:hypothetical protein ACE1B6_17975 [Aerosakkonemataceae cyanobacterium BLCC-F154]|uniref:Uncharacterized protein n=1 Tax=Floridaenema fluviatile BLCC-F154 TaxID=3153640 RepID=A0ABV4YG83_9CYAN
MSIRKGGRGNSAPYKTQMVRTPEPLLELAKQLTEGYRQVLGTDREQEYLDSVQKAISNGYYPDDTSTSDERLKALQTRLSAIEEIIGTYQEQSKPTRDWTKANQLITDLKGF